MTEPRTVRSFCRVCTSLCGILVDVAGDEVLHVRGDREHPLSGGYTCAKGRALPQLHHHPRRIEHPLMRVDGQLTATSWDACLDDLGTRLAAIIDEHGPSSVGIYFGSGVGMDAVGYRMSEALHAAIGTPARFSPLTIDGTAKTVVAGLVGGFPGLNPRPDYDNLRLVVYIGVNPVVSHGHTTAMPSPSVTLRALRERADVWVLDPRRSETAEFATEHMAPRPGGDYAVLAHLVRELLCDGAGAARCVDSDALRAAVEPFDRDHAAAVAGVPGEQLSRFVEAVRRAGRLAIETGTGVTMSASANVTQWLAFVAMILTDSMNRPGGAWFHPGFVRRVDASELPVIPAEYLFGPGAPSRPDLQGFLGEWPCAALPDEINAGNIKAFLNLGGSLITAFPEERALRAALEKLDLFASLEIIENETTALSSHVLPTKDQLERPDITLWDFLSPRVVAQYSPAVIEPVGDRRSTWWVLAELGKRLGHDLVARMVGDEKAELSDDGLLATMMSGARCSFDELVSSQYVEVPHEIPAPWVEEHLDRLGGWRLAPEQLVAQLSELSALDPAAPLCLTPRRQSRHLNAQFTFLGDRPEILMSPADAVTAGVADGQSVVVASPNGQIVGTARVDEHLRVGTVSVPHGYEHANVNMLTSNRQADPLTGMARYSGLPVEVRPARPEQEADLAAPRLGGGPS